MTPDPFALRLEASRGMASFTLEEAREAIAQCLAENAQANVDPVARRLLNTLGWRLEAMLKTASNPQTVDWCFNQNWRGPALADVIDACERQRGMGQRFEGVAGFTGRSAAPSGPSRQEASQGSARLSTNARKERAA